MNAEDREGPSVSTVMAQTGVGPGPGPTTPITSSSSKSLTQTPTKSSNPPVSPAASPSPSVASSSSAPFLNSRNRPHFSIPSIPEIVSSSSSPSKAKQPLPLPLAPNSSPLKISSKSTASTRSAPTPMDVPGQGQGQGQPSGACSTDGSSASQAVLLGIQTLERQQEERERKKQRQETYDRVLRANPFDHPRAKTSHSHRERLGTSFATNRPQDHRGVPMTVHVTGATENDELTTESDFKNGTDTNNPASTISTTASGTSQTGKKHTRVASITKFFITPLKPIRRSISDKFSKDPTPRNNTETNTKTSKQRMVPILFGNLHKLGRNGKWQKRWFECDGTSLRYFKTIQKTKLLATLDLTRVGMISLDYADDTGCTFTIEVAGREYYLCTDTKERAKDWVITLNRVKEARMQIGGLKLVDPYIENDDSVLAGNKHRRSRSNSDSDEDDVPSSRVVMTTTRPRTKGLGKDDFSEMEKSVEEEDNTTVGQLALASTMSPSSGDSSNMNSPLNAHNMKYNITPLLRTVPMARNQVAVRWTKQRSALQNVGRRLSRWAKRMTMVRCVVKNDVVHFNTNTQDQDLIEDGTKKRTVRYSPDNESESEEPFIDLDIARYSNCPESYVAQNCASSSNNIMDEDAENSSSSIHKSASLKAQKLRSQNSYEPSVSGSSVQSSLSPSHMTDDDNSRTIA